MTCSESSELNPDNSNLKLQECIHQELNDFNHELNLSKISSELLVFPLRDKNPLYSETTVTVYQDKEKGFSHREVAFVSCHNVNMLLLALGIKSIIPCLGGCSLTHQNEVSNEICNNGMNK